MQVCEQRLITFVALVHEVYHSINVNSIPLSRFLVIMVSGHCV